MRALMSLALVMWASAAIPGQQTPNRLSDESVAALRSLQAAALVSDYALTQLTYLTDSIGPRLSGSPQNAAAVAYVAAELRKLGLEVRLEDVQVPHWVRGEERAVARVGVVAAIVAAFGGVISEVGAVMLVGGNIEGKTRVLTTAIVLNTRTGDFALALALGVILLTLAFIANVAMLRLQSFSNEK